MEEFDKIFERFQISEKSETSIKEFSNWLFGISIGLCALMISLSDRLSISNISFIKPLFISILLLSMINVFITALIKYLIFKRETSMMISHGALKKIALFHQIQKNSTFNRVEWDNHFTNWSTEYNKLPRIARFFYISIFMNMVTAIITGIAIIVIVI